MKIESRCWLLKSEARSGAFRSHHAIHPLRTILIPWYFELLAYSGSLNLLTPRDAGKVRKDAIRMGIKKAHAGCESCAEQYFDLARRHGATEREISAAIHEASGLGPGVVSRRRLLQIAAAGAGALALGSLPDLAAPADASCIPCYTGTTKWGTHDGTHYLPGKATQNFYIFACGDGVTYGGSPPDSTALANAGEAATYMYWNVYGPSGQSDPYGWGMSQAYAAVSTWFGTNGFPYWNDIGGVTIFGTVIPSRYPNYWLGNTQAANEACLEGWLDGIPYWSQGPGQPAFLKNGIYTSPRNDWPKVFPDSYIPHSHMGSMGPLPFVLWLSADCWSMCGAGLPPMQCPPCTANSLCTDPQSGCYTKCEVIKQINSAQFAAVGGQQTVIWHYWNFCAPCTNHDYDVALQDTSSGFTNIAAVHGPKNGCSGGCPC